MTPPSPQSHTVPPLPSSLSVSATRPGTTPIASADEPGAGVLLLHGFSGSPWDLRPVAETLISRGYSVALPLLAGHGTEPDDLAGTTWQDWLADARASYEWLAARAQRVHVVGLSMGALLSLLLARQELPRPVASLTLLAPALSLAPHVAFALRAMDHLGRPRRVARSRWQRGPQPQPRSPAYAAIPVAAALSVLELQEVVRGVQPAAACPTLALHGTRDATIPHDRARRLMAPLLSAGGRWRSIYGAGHVLPRSRQAEEVISAVVAFIDEQRGPGLATT